MWHGQFGHFTSKQHLLFIFPLSEQSVYSSLFSTDLRPPSPPPSPPAPTTHREVIAHHWTATPSSPSPPVVHHHRRFDFCFFRSIHPSVSPSFLSSPSLSPPPPSPSSSNLPPSIHAVNHARFPELPLCYLTNHRSTTLRQPPSNIRNRNQNNIIVETQTHNPYKKRDAEKLKTKTKQFF